MTYLVGGLLLLVALLVGGGLGLVRKTLLLSESLPALTKNLADLSCAGVRDRGSRSTGCGLEAYRRRYRGSRSSRYRAARSRRTCRRKDHAWGHWDLERTVSIEFRRRASGVTIEGKHRMV